VSNLARAGQILDGGRFPTLELVVISDLQRTSFDDSLTVDLPANVTTYLLPIGTVSHDNVAVTRVDVASSIVDIDQPVKLRVEVSNYSEAALSDWGVSLYLEGERVAQTTIDLAAGETGRATLTASPRARGWLTGYVEIEDDEFVDDNRRYFTLHVAEARQILLVRGLGSDTRYLELVLSRDIARGESVFSLELIAESALSSTSLNDFDAIVLHGVNSLSSGQITALTRFVSNGGGVMIFEGAEEGAPGVSALVEAMGGGRFTNYLGTAGSGVPVSAASRFDREHPLFASVFETEATVGSEVEKPVVFRMRTYLPGDGDEQTIIAASGGEPFMQEIRGQQGRVLVLPFLAQPDWSDLPVRGLFVPLLHRSMYYLTSADQTSGDGFVIGTLPQYRVAASGAASRIVIRAVGGEEWVPEQRPGIQGVVFTIPRSITTPGVYDIVIDGVVSSKIAINSAPLESDLRRITVTEAREFLEQITDSPVTVLQSLSLTDASAMSSRGGDGMEIWNVFLGLALLIMVTEMLVAMK